MQTDHIYDAAGVAAALGLEPRQFETRRARLVRHHGFPRPLPMTPLRWSRASVEAWIAANGDAVAPGDDTPPQPPRHPHVIQLENYRSAS